MSEQASKRARTAEVEEQGAVIINDDGGVGEPDSDGVLAAALEELEAVQDKVDDLSVQQDKEILLLAHKYSQLQKPLLQARAHAIQNIPDFWPTVFYNHPDIAAVISEQDDVLLQHLVNVDVEEDEETKVGFSVTMTFASNPFFDNERLTYELVVEDSDLVPKVSTIRWKPGQCPFAEDSATTDPSSGEKRKEASTAPSLFQMFAADTADELQHVAKAIKFDVWPNPLQYFQGTVMEEDGEEGGEDEDGEDEAGSVPGGEAELADEDEVLLELEGDDNVGLEDDLTEQDAEQDADALIAENDV
eukprot:m.107389 g.107389  ORF g.107389 m.107389 type:complete len:303 (+) comp15847_c0_seq3:43-951(+)